MGLFDKKLKKPSDDFDSPVEEISLSGPSSPARPAASVVPVKMAPSSRASEAASSHGEPPPTPREPPSTGSYGIDQAIALMRQLPPDNIELVVTVVKTTLESTHVRVSTIIKDANRKLADIEGRVEFLKKEIAEREAEISNRKDQIATLEADHKETSVVKERLIMAEQATKKSEPVGPSVVASAPPPAPSAAPSGASGSAGGRPPPLPSNPLGTTLALPGTEGHSADLGKEA